jgi:hypothetical protein
LATNENVNESYGNLFSNNHTGYAKARQAKKKNQNLKYEKNTTTYSELTRRYLTRIRGQPFHII